MENFRSFRGLASNREGFPANFFFFIIKCFELLYNRESFPANNKKIVQPQNFSTTNDLHYTVYALIFINNLGGGHTHKHSDVRTETILRNQACAGHRLVCTWFKNSEVYILINQLKYEICNNS